MASNNMNFDLTIRKQFRLDDLFTDASESSTDEIDPEFLRKQSNWIRDDLDPMVSRDGPDGLKPDQVVAVFQLLDQLRRSRVPVQHIRYSRIHLAVACIAGQATRWPSSVIDTADKLLENWTTRYGALSEIGHLLYEEGGRLHGVCGPNDLSKEVLEVRWAKSPTTKTGGTGYARQHGDIGFKPGECANSFLSKIAALCC